MFLKPHQMYLESQGLYQKICRLAQVRTEIKSLTVEEDHLVQCIYDAMCPATEIVDLVFLRAQKGVSDADLSEMFVARWQESERIMDVHPAYVSDRFRPGNNVSEAPVTTTTEKEAERSKEEEREVAVVIENEKDEDVEKGKEAEEADDADADINVKNFIAFFNQEMDSHNAKIPRIVSLNGNRLKALKARCREYTKDKVAEVVRKAAVEPFLNGAGDKGWVASLDWLLKPNSFCKVLEGYYTQYHGKSRGPSPELLAINREIERQQHEELHRRLDEQRRGAVTYEEYQRMLKDGELKIEN